jgi:Zn-dependent protease with chaperone function
VETNLLVLILLIELVMLVTVSAPLFFAGKFDSHPDIGMALWFTSLTAAILATIAAFGIATWSIFETWLRLNESADLGFTILASFAPWVLLALAGVLLALVNQRLSPLFQAAKDVDLLANLVSREVMTHRGIQVMELDIPGYFAVTKNRKIYLSKAAFQLPQRQLDAVLRHEMGHIKLNHELVKRFAYLIYQLLPWFAASRALKFEVERLCELSADKYALIKVYSKDLHEARKLFIS